MFLVGVKGNIKYNLRNSFNNLNTSYIQGLRLSSKALHLVTRQKKYIVGGILKLKNAMVNMRLLWAIQNIPELTEALKTERENVMFGTLDCWLLFKLSGDKKLHLCPYSNAAATGMGSFNNYVDRIWTILTTHPS